MHRYYPGPRREVNESPRGTSETALRKIGRPAAKLVRRKVKERDDRVSLGFWHATANGAVNQERAIEAQDWTELRRNYSAPVAGQFERLDESSSPRT